MKLLKKRSVAIIVMVAAIALSSLYGLSRAPALHIPEGGPSPDTSLSTAAYEQYIVDNANVLSAKTEKSLSVYNANWDRWAGSVLAVVTVKSAASSMEDAAYDWANTLQLGENDALLLLNSGAEDAYFLTSGNFYDAVAGKESLYLSSCVYEGVSRGDYNVAAENLFGSINLLFSDAAGKDGGSSAGALALIAALFPLLLLVAGLVALFSLLDSLRYRSWRRRYGSMACPPVVYRPILWWHGPRSSWYRRRHSPPPPMGGGPRPPMGGSPRPGGFGGSSRPGGFGGTSRPGGFGGTARPSGGAFGGSGRVGGGSLSSRGGTFGSSGRVGGGGFSRGGGFGSGRSGGGGFSRGGGSGRGGGFGRR